MKFDYLIVGAGLSGAVCANLLTSRGSKCCVIDRRLSVGGNLRCEKIHGIDVHLYGAHIFRTSNPQVWEYVNRFTSFNKFVNSPVANYRGEMYNLPFNMNTFNQLWGAATPEEAKRFIEETRVKNEHPQNLEEHVLNLVGREIYEKLIKGYTEKQWGKSCKELPPDIMRRIPLRFTYDNNYFNDRWQGIPEIGYNALIEALLENSYVLTGIDYTKNRSISKSAKRVIYTGPLDEYYGYEFGELEYRGLEFELESHDCENVQGVAVVNYTDKDVPYTRTIEHKHFVLDTTSPMSVISKEYPVKWKRGMEPFYPVNDRVNNEKYQKYRDKADKEGLICCGRMAEYKYTDMSETIENAMKCVDRITRNDSSASCLSTMNRGEWQ